MAKTTGATIIKKYANRRLYHTGTSTYVTLDDLATMVKEGEDFVVQDAKTGEDITHSVLTQIIFEQEGKSGQTMLPVSVLRQLISFYGDQMQAIVPSYLEASMSAFGKEQENFREQMASMVGKSPVEVMASTKEMMADQTRRNMELFQDAMRMFNPFVAAMGDRSSDEERAVDAEGSDDVEEAPKKSNDELKAMRDQIAEMQKRIESMGK